jgi:HK97 family phage prohead protease
MERRDFVLSEVKLAGDGGKAGVFSGYGAMFGNVDAYGDVIEKGAFAESLKEWKAQGKLPPMLLQHGGGFMGGADDWLPVGKWTDMVENAKGLKVEGELFALGTERGQYIYEGLKAGALDGLSIGFMTRKSKMGTKPGEPSRTLLEIDLKEVSIVTFPANPKARVTGVKALAPDEIRELEEYLCDEGLSRKAAKRSVSNLMSKLRLRDEGGLPENALRDEVAPVLSNAAAELAATTDKLMASILGGLLKF